MQRQTIRLATHDGGKEVEGYVSDRFPGIAIHRNARFSDLWVATHLASGLGLSCDFRLRRIAGDFATEAGRLVDFTKSEDEVTAQVGKDHGLRTRLRNLAEQYKAA